MREGAMSTKRESDRGLGSGRKIFAADGSPREGCAAARPYGIIDADITGRGRRRFGNGRRTSCR
jgi:hypothetical protein